MNIEVVENAKFAIKCAVFPFDLVLVGRGGAFFGCPFLLVFNKQYPVLEGWSSQFYSFLKFLNCVFCVLVMVVNFFLQDIH